MIIEIKKSGTEIKMKLIILLFTAIAVTSCKKFIQVDTPDNRLLKSTVFNNNQTAISVVNQIFSSINSSGSYWSLGFVQLHAGLSADEIVYSFLSSDPVMGSYYQNTLTPQSISTTNMWAKTYPILFTINDAIEGISASEGLVPDVKKQLLAEAKFMRAFCYFYLVNFYGNVPLVLTTDYNKNSTISKSTVDDIYKQIIADLQEAYGSLSDKFLDGTLLNETNERVRPTKWAAAALLAKVYLFTEKWDLAEEKSTEVIQNNSLFNLDTLNGVFLKNSVESILQFQPTNFSLNTSYAPFFVMPGNAGVSVYQPTYLSTHLLNSFESNDQRKAKWIGYSSPNGSAGPTYAYPYKYKQYKSIANSDPLTEYYVILRLAEQFLIRAEARTQKGNLIGAAADLNTIRLRANLDKIEATTKQEILDAILHERQVELFVEWGDRWMDLRRTNKIDAIMNIVCAEKGGKWSNYKKYYPISFSELQSNPNLKQTDGY